MKALLINGSPNEHGCTYTALSEVGKTLKKHGIETELLYLGKKPIKSCTACFACRQTGRCVFKDAVTDVQDRIDTIDALILGSPVYYGSATGHLKSFLDRLFFPLHERMAGKLGAAVVSCRRGGASATFDQLNKYSGRSPSPPKRWLSARETSFPEMSGDCTK